MQYCEVKDGAVVATRAIPIGTLCAWCEYESVEQLDDAIYMNSVYLLGKNVVKRNQPPGALAHLVADPIKPAFPRSLCGIVQEIKRYYQTGTRNVIMGPIAQGPANRYGMFAIREIAPGEELLQKTRISSLIVLAAIADGYSYKTMYNRSVYVVANDMLTQLALLVSRKLKPNPTREEWCEHYRKIDDYMVELLDKMY